MASAPHRLLLAVGICLIATTALAQEDGLWNSRELGIQVRAPSRWSVLSGGSTEAVLVPPVGDGKIAVFALPLSEAARQEPDVSALADAAIASLKESFKKFKLLSRREVEVAGRPAEEIYFSGRVDGAKFRFVQTVLPHHDHQIILMYMSPEDAYSVHLGDYDQTIRSVRWLPRG